MAKKRRVERIYKRKKIINKYYFLRLKYKQACKSRGSLSAYIQIQSERQKLPRNSSSTRLCNRCNISGRSRGYYRYFGLSRHFFREIAYQGILPGVRKSSW
jgi:small subunit ribosomal protein S14